MKFHWLSESVAVASYQSVFSNFKATADAGFLHIVDNRSSEENTNSSSNEIVAATYGITYSCLPVTFPEITAQDALQFSDILECEESPALAYCKTGVRSAVLWVISEVLRGRETLETALSAVKASGLDLEGAHSFIEQILASENRT